MIHNKREELCTEKKFKNEDSFFRARVHYRQVTAGKFKNGHCLIIRFVYYSLLVVFSTYQNAIYK